MGSTRAGLLPAGIFPLEFGAKAGEVGCVLVLTNNVLGRIMKLLNLALAALTLAALAATPLPAEPQPQGKVEVKERISVEVIIGKRPGNPREINLMKMEEREHPNIVKAMHDIRAAIKALDEAPDNFGGHKQLAKEDLEKAYVSLRKALYFRLWEDNKH